jgi:hypothetical protein
MQANSGVAWSPILEQGNFHKASRFARVKWVLEKTAEPSPTELVKASEPGAPGAASPKAAGSTSAGGEARDLSVTKKALQKAPSEPPPASATPPSPAEAPEPAPAPAPPPPGTE